MNKIKYPLLTLGLACLLASCSKCSGKNSTDASNDATSAGAAASTGLVIEDVKTGDGAVAEANKLVSVHYTGTLENGQKFDSSKDRGEPFEFTLGIGQVIKGWDQGVQGMKVGGVRKLTIPPELGYGERGAGNVIPPNSVLHFEVELLDVKN